MSMRLLSSSLFIHRTPAHCFYCWGGFIVVFPMVNCTSTNSGKTHRDSSCKQNKVQDLFGSFWGWGDRDTLFISGKYLLYYYMHLAWDNPTALVLVITKQETSRTCHPSFPEQLECTKHHIGAQSQAKHPSLETKTLQVNSCSLVPMLLMAG